MHYKCLAGWKALDGENYIIIFFFNIPPSFFLLQYSSIHFFSGQNYVALMDTELPQLGEEIRPRYRCGVSPAIIRIITIIVIVHFLLFIIIIMLSIVMG